MSGINLNFHQTFPPEREHIGRLLMLADEMDFMTKEQIFQATGIPTGARSGKVVPHIRYAHYMGLLNVEQEQTRYRLTKSALGQEVARVDPFLVEPISQLLCHYTLTSRAGAPLWHFIVREYLATHGTTVNRSNVKRAAQARFGTKVTLSPFVSSYSRDTSFGPLGLLQVSRERDTWSFEPHAYDRVFRYVYAYTLLTEWDRHSPDIREVTLDDVVTRFEWGWAFLWDTPSVLDALSSLQDLAVVKLNRQLDPVTVIRTMATETVLLKLFSLLV